MTRRADHRFWINPDLPYLEARWVREGRGVCYAPHSHSTASVGLILGGQSDYRNGQKRAKIGPGTVVLMDPEQVHACNPQDDQPWSYLMVYLDPQWLASLHQDVPWHEAEAATLPAFSSILSRQPAVVEALQQVYRLLGQKNPPRLALESQITGLFSDLVGQLLPPAAPQMAQDPTALVQAAAYIADCWDQRVSLDDLCQVSGLSASHLIRCFKACYGMTPHAYLNNHRINRAKGLLRHGYPLAETALAAGFADQAHFQRVFKRLTAATPGTYAGARQAAPSH
jgi:AraC-like DNA-binding protein